MKAGIGGREAAVAAIVLGTALIGYWAFEKRGGTGELSAAVPAGSSQAPVLSQPTDRLQECLQLQPQVDSGTPQELCTRVLGVLKEAERIRGLTLDNYAAQNVAKCLEEARAAETSEDSCKPQYPRALAFVEATVIALCDGGDAVVRYPKVVIEALIVRRGDDVYMDRKPALLCRHRGEPREIEYGFVPLGEAEPGETLIPPAANGMGEAIEANDVASFQKLAAQFDWPAHPYAQTWLMGQAAASENPAFLKLLLERNLPVNTPVMYYEQPLASALDHGREGAALALIERGARLDIPSNSFHPMQVAAERGLAQVVARMLAKGVDANAQQVDDGAWVVSTPIEAAAWRGDEATVALLFRKGATVSGKAPFLQGSAEIDIFPIDSAAHGGKLGIVQAFLDDGASIKPGNEEHVVSAIEGANPKVLKLLLKHGLTLPTDPKRQDKIREALSKVVGDQQRALEDEADAASYPRIDGVAFLRILLEHGLQLEQADKEPYLDDAMGAAVTRCRAWEKPEVRPIAMAQQAFAVAVAEATIKAGLDINRPDSSGRTLLMTAMQQGHGGVTKILLDNGADPKLRNQDGKTAAEIVADIGAPLFGDTVTCAKSRKAGF